MSLAVEAHKEDAFYQFLNAQIHKPYDSTAIWGFASGRNWRDPNDWFCSELQCAALEAAGIFPQLYTPSNKVTPVALAMLMSDHGALLS
jgi:hypothetical protein